MPAYASASKVVVQCRNVASCQIDSRCFKLAQALEGSQAGSCTCPYRPYIYVYTYPQSQGTRFFNAHMFTCKPVRPGPVLEPEFKLCSQCVHVYPAITCHTPEVYRSVAVALSLSQVGSFVKAASAAAPPEVSASDPFPQELCELRCNTVGQLNGPHCQQTTNAYASDTRMVQRLLQ
jgi:hypothetical protein